MSLLKNALRRNVSPKLLVYALCMVVNLAGCTYEVAIAPRRDFQWDTRLLGWWEFEGGQVNIVKRWTGQYKIILNPGTSYESIFTAYPSDVAGHKFLNICIEKSKADLLKPFRKRFVYCDYSSTHPNGIQFRFVSNKAVPSSLRSSDEIRSAIERNLGKSSFYEKRKIVLTRGSEGRDKRK